MAINLIDTAKKYLALGISVVGCNKNKRSIGTWSELQNRRLSTDEVNLRFSSADGIAIICGQISGGLEVLDVDLKYDITGTLFNDLKKSIDKKLWSKLVIAETVSSGYHLYYRCKEIQGNQKLASREATDEELADNPHAKIFVLLETRGSGGYVVAPPSKGYRFVQGNEESILEISINERESLLQAARSFNQHLEPPVAAYEQSTGGDQFTLTPWEDFNKRGDVLRLLAAHGWTYVNTVGEKHFMRRPGKDKGTSGDYHQGKGWFSVFTTSSEFEANKAYTPFAVYAMLECKNDFKEAAKRLSSQGYGVQRNQIPKGAMKVVLGGMSAGLSNDDLLNQVASKIGVTSDQAREIIRSIESSKGEKIESFWSVSIAKSGKTTITILRDKLSKFLYERGGFQRYYYNRNTSKSFRIVCCRDGMVEDVNMADIQDYVIEYIRSLPNVFDSISKNELIEVLRSGALSYFSEKDASFLEAPEINFIKDDENKSYFFFKNTIVVVTKDGCSAKKYSSSEGFIWKSQLIPFDIKLINDFKTKDGTAICEYESFLSAVCADDIERLASAVSIIGYLLHQYKDPSRPYAIILAEETDNEENGGGTGKGIFITAISKLINTVNMDGKNWNPSKNFAFQRVGLDTKLIAIQDVKKNIDFELFYSLITEGVTSEKKNLGEIFIPYSDSAKIIFTTNYSIKSESNHARRRQKTIIFSPYFSPEHTPEQEFGHMLFTHWDEGEWNAFYNYMFEACRVYLDHGIIDVKEDKPMKNKKIKNTFGEEFREWFVDYTANGCENFVAASDLYSQFISEQEVDTKYFSSKKFRKAMENSCRILGYKFYRRKNSAIGGRYEFAVQK